MDGKYSWSLPFRGRTLFTNLLSCSRLNKRHASVLPSGRKPRAAKCEERGCPLLHCPFCPLYQGDYSKVETHLQSHLKTVVQHGDLVMYTCKWGCRKESHYHRCGCTLPFPRKEQPLRHLSGRPRPRTALAPRASEGQLRPPEGAAGLRLKVTKETEETGTEPPAGLGCCLPNRMEEDKFELKMETPLVPCRMEALNASPSHSEDETEEGGPASEKDDDDLDEEEEMAAAPAPARDSDSEENVGRGLRFASFSLDEMMDIGTVDQQEQEAQMNTEDNNGGAELEEEDAEIEPDADPKPSVDVKVAEEMDEEVAEEEEKEEKEVAEEEKEEEEVAEEEKEEEEEVAEEEKEVAEEEKEVAEKEKEVAEEEKEKKEVAEEENEEEEKEKDVAEEEEAKEVEEEKEEQQQEEKEEVPFYATRSKSKAATTSADMTNGMKVVKLSASASSSSSSSSPPLVKIKDEPVDEEYEVALVSGAAAVKDEPVAAKEEEDLQIESVYSVTPDGDGRRQRGVRPSSSSTTTLNMSCAHCRTGLLKGQTAYQRKGSPALFCSTGCLTSSLSSSKSTKNCYRCQKRISRPQDVILAPDADGVSRGFCSETCLNAFNLKKSSVKALAPSDDKLQSPCSMCAKHGISKHEVILSGTVHNMCSDSCFQRFRTANRLTMAGCANCATICHVRPLLLKMEGSSKTLCNLDCLIKYKKKVKTSLPCAMCRALRPLADMVHNKSTDDSVSLFCSSSCVMAFMVQTVSSSGAQLNCDNCGKRTLPAYHLAMSDTTIRNFCTLSCVMTFQEKFKVKQKQATIFPKLPVASGQEQSGAQTQGAAPALCCAQCARQMTTKPDVIHVKDKVVFVCGWSCALEFKTSKNVSAKCEYCKLDKISREVKRIDGRDRSFCSHGCKLLYEHDLDKRWGKHCKSCSYCQCVSRKLEKALYGESSEEFCSEECRSNYTMLFCHVAKCASCGRKGKLKHSLFVLGEVRNFCDLPCLFHFCNLLVTTQGDVFPPDSPVIANVVSLADQAGPAAAADKPAKQQVGDYEMTLRKRKEDSHARTVPRIRGADSQTTDADVVLISAKPAKKATSSATSTAPSTTKSMKNKALLCKPLVQNKGVSCRTQTLDVEAQTDVSIPKIMVLPVPVPVYVPVPMSLYSQCTPKPVGVPLPLPVPVFLPVNMDNADRIVNTIKKIKDKYPEDPFEAEVVLMAEMVSETNGGADQETETRPGAAAGGEAMSTYSDDLNTDDLANLLNSWDEPSAPPPAMDIEADFPVETLERMASLREQSSPPASPTPTGSRKRQASRKTRETRGRKRSSKGTKGSAAKSSVPKVPKLKSEYGVDAWKRWIRWRDTQPDVETPRIGMRPLVPKEDLLRCTTAELSYGLCRFIGEVERPSGERYSADSLFYLCLGIQQHLFENGRVENIFTDGFYCKFSTDFTNMLRGFQPSLTTSGYIHSRVEEEFLWDCKQLGVYSPIVLLNTLLYFFCKNFGFTTPEQHRQLSFAHVMRCTKTGQGNKKTTFLRFYPPIAPNDGEPDADGVPAKRRREEDEDEMKEEKILEMKENTDNPLRCPVRLYEFYLSKCSETVKQRTDVFYLLPERCCVPNSPLWFSATPLDEDTKEAMLTRILAVRQLHVVTRQQTLAPEEDEDVRRPHPPARQRTVAPEDNEDGGGSEDDGGGGDDDDDDAAADDDDPNDPNDPDWQ
ncbi:zinc finger MYM-type protein 4 isoform X1 [Phyllopteryx taeniolatus]|uniref:zinc finger MYM-type protein 4 isoform X1 n=1 Tax=Phyllopteryx taeniolatus TaxID=161469 RepID=UPI002AD425B2|nr:zinc finger MYM-type protein 4 isoform X1 [Phyllopteryx taeniolatus]